MIRLGLNSDDKKLLITEYIHNHPEVTNVIEFAPPEFSMQADWEQYTYDDIIMYKTFYPLLEKIDDHYLIVVNECLRTQKRNDLTYNCLHHYLRQTQHHIVFEYFPFVTDSKDFLILADNDHPDRWKGHGYEPVMLKELDIAGVRRTPVVSIIDMGLDQDSDAVSAYNEERDRLFDTLGNKSPDTIPRNLHVWCGKLKLPAIKSDVLYIARNKRLKLANVIPYKDADSAQHRISIDMPVRQMNLNDYLKRTGEDKITFLSTGLPVDEYYARELISWAERLDIFYDQAGICQ